MKKQINVLHFTGLTVASAYYNNLQSYTDSEKVRYVFATFTKKGDWSEQLEERGATVYNLCINKKDEDMDWLELPKLYKPLTEIIEKEKIDIIHPHLIFPTLFGVGLAKLKRIKSVFTRHHSDAVHVLKSPVKRNFYLRLEKFINKNADHIIAPSRTVRDILIEKEGVPAEKVSLIPYGQTFERFSAVTPEIVEQKRRELGMDKQFSMVCVSRLFHAKGHTYLFEALAPLFKNGLNAKLYLVGTGDYRPVLEKKVKELGIAGSVVFLGWRDDILAVIASSDLVVHPSLEDALSQSLIESLMLARPIVATDISGAADILDGGKYGKLVPPADSTAFRNALQETLDNFDVAGENAKKGKEYLLEYMNAKRAADEYTKIYYRILEK